VEQTEIQAIVDGEHLRLIRIGYLVSAGLAAIFSCFGILYALMGLMVGSMARGASRDGPPIELAWFFALFGFLFVAMGLGLAAARAYAARCVRERRARIYCIVIAIISCLEFPYGTVFGVLTIIVLSRPSVQAMFHDRTVI
jgi:hypothetical protein